MHKILISSHNVTLLNNIHVQIKSLDLYHKHIFKYIEDMENLWCYTLNEEAELQPKFQRTLLFSISLSLNLK